MTRYLLSVLLFLAMIIAGGCGGSKQPAVGPPQGNQESDASSSGDEKTMTIKGKTTLAFWEEDQPPEQRERPVFEITSESCGLTDTGVWALDKATAVLSTAEGEEMRIEAGAARFDEASKSAVLSKGAIAHIGGKEIVLEDLEYHDKDRVAKSEKALTLREGETSMNASGMEFWPRKNLLVLREVVGAVGMGEKDAARGGSARSVKALDLRAPVPVVEFLDHRLDRMSGGVHIAVAFAAADAAPLDLAAQEIAFSWPGKEAASPDAIRLTGAVRVKLEEDGLEIESNEAQLDLVAGRLTFSGNVTGRADILPHFESNSLSYNLDTGDSQMTNLRATGIPLSAADSQEGTGHSLMDVEHASDVRFAAGRVQQMSGGVTIRLRGAGEGASDLEFKANTITFGWAGGGSAPSTIHLREKVYVKAADGDIWADQADVDAAAKTIVFKDNVIGNTPQIRRFDCDTIAYNLASRDSTLTNLRASKVPIAAMGTEGGSGDEQKYSAMDIIRAPEVLMRAGAFQRITGGVEIALQSEDPAVKPMRLSGRELHFAYAEGEPDGPQRIELREQVEVLSDDTSIRANLAEISLADRKLVFSGDVSGDLPSASGFRTNRVVYDLGTGDAVLAGMQVDQFQEPPAEDRGLLTVENIGDWSKLVAAIQSQAASAQPTPGKRITELLEPGVARQMLALPTDRELDAYTKDKIIGYLNGLLRKQDFFDEASWQGVQIEEQARAALKLDLSKLSEKDMCRLNRSLLMSAFPEAFAQPSGQQ